MPFLLLLALGAPPQDAERQVREALGELERALAAPDESLGDRFDLYRLVREMERSGAISDASGDGGYRLRRLEQHLGGMAAAPGALRGGWQRLQPLSVRLNPARNEAEATCRVTIGGTKSRFRFWLVHDGGAWKPYDLENMDGSFRLSVIGLQHTPGVHDDEERYALRDSVMAFQRGAMYLAQGKPVEAREAMLMARRCGPPAYVAAWIDLVDGQALGALGEPEAGLKAAAGALARHKDLSGAHRLKAACHLALGEPAQAILAAKEYLRLVGNEPEAWTLIGQAHERLDQPELAIEAYRKAAESDDEDAPSRLELGRLLLQRRRTPEAKSFLEAAARLAPGLFPRAADLLDREGAHAEALEIANEAASRRPDDKEVLLRRGRALRKLGRSREAEEALRHAAILEPEDREIRTELVFALAETGKDAEARERMTSDACVHAFVHAAAGRTAQAIESLKPVLREEARLQSLLLWIDQEKVFDRVREEARALLDPARATRDYWTARQNPKLTPEEMLRTALDRIQAVPGYAFAHADQAHALRRLGRPAEAEPAIRKAIELDPNKSVFQTELGRILAAQGKLAEALAVADALVKAGPKAEESGLDLRVASYALAGKREHALKSLQDLLERHPAWHASVTAGADLDDFRKLPAVQDLIRKARARTRK